VADWPVSATAGQFDQEFLKGIFRSSVIGRLARGDVVVKDALPDGSMVDYSLVLLPLMASRTPEGIVILYVRGNSVISAREQQGLGLLGEIIGVGLKALSSLDGPTEDYQARGAEMEATVALGRLSAGLAHEINNAVTILRNNTEQMAVNAKRFGTGDATDLITEESIRAVETIRGLTDALRAFAPEETRDTEEVDLCRIVDMVVASVRFYAKRGINVSVHSPTDGELVVTCRSHYLIRSLFLIFVELVESALASGRILMVNISLARAHREVTCTVIVSAGPYNFPSVLLSQLDKDGVLVRLTGRAGARLSYEVREEDLSLTLSLPALHGETLKSIAPPAPSTPPSHSILPTPRGTILIVDDEPAIIRSTRRILEKEHDILAAASAAEALDIIRSGRKIDLLLLDVFMPEMSGLDLAEVLKRQHQGLASRIIFITGGASDQEVSRYMARTKLPVLEKPLDIHLLNTRIAEMLTSR